VFRGAADERAWEPVIGLEVHVQLRTQGKLFSSAPNTFGAPPNAATTEVDLGLPGVLPVPNAHAVELALRAAVALGCSVRGVSRFERKHYFYPDLPKGYQVSQYQEPLAEGGAVPVEQGGALRAVPLTRIHMEEDAGKSIHDDALSGRGASLVDLNRAGVPLVEIVSEPALRSPEEAGDYLRSLGAILRDLEVSDVDLEKGQFRCDANVSVRRRGDTALGARVELKNINSFRSVERALAHEIERQIERLEDGNTIEQETRHWDDGSGRSRPSRSKEDAQDYRYFPDPDLPPLRVEPARVEAIRRALPELPHARRARLQEAYGLSAADARVLGEQRAVAALFEATARGTGDARLAATWIQRDVLELLSGERALAELALTPENLAQLLTLVKDGRVTPAGGREILAELAARGGEPAAIARARGLEAVSDAGELESMAREVLAANPAQVGQYRGGDQKVLNFLLGQLVRRSGGKADARAARAILQRLLDSVS
jgi:aspartyl-tRNA(Asn)/glutamyl-tRNA(Gln) amidotransferase subunit B